MTPGHDPRAYLEAAPVLKGKWGPLHLQSGSESGSEESCPSMVSHNASCKGVSCPWGLIPMGCMTLCLQEREMGDGELRHSNIGVTKLPPSIGESVLIGLQDTAA